MLLFISDDEYDQSVQTKQKDRIKVIVEQQNEGAATYGDYCMLILEIMNEFYTTKKYEKMTALQDLLS